MVNKTGFTNISPIDYYSYIGKETSIQGLKGKKANFIAKIK
jgi:hypothetical protein